MQSLTRCVTLFIPLFLISTSHLTAAEYARYAQDSVTITSTGDPNRNLNVGGSEIDIEDNEGELIPSSYALAPFQFHPRDFSLSTVDTINSISLGFRNDVSNFTDPGNVQVFYVPDSREDFGVPTFRDQEADPCTFGSPQSCYEELSYDTAFANGIDASQFSAAPVLLGEIEVDAISPPAFGNATNEDYIKTIVDLDTAAAASMIDRINTGQGFHLLFGALQDDILIEIGSFNTNRAEGPGADIRPQLIIDASGIAAGVTKDLNHHGAIHADGDALNNDFYGSGNDDNFSEYGIANFQFAAEEFGVDSVSTLGIVELTLAHSERGFTDGDMVEFFFTSDTAEELGFDSDPFVGYGQNLTYDSTLENGIDDSQYTSAPISLGTYPYVEKSGGIPETFTLQIPDEVETELIGAINDGDDFHILIASPDPDWDITFSGKDSAFDPGNPQLTISLDAGPVGDPLDLNNDGVVDAEDAPLVCSQPGELPLLAGDADLNGTVEFADFLQLSGSFGQAGHYGQGDFDCNGTVEFADFLLLSGNFGATNAAAQSVPEPHAMSLVFLSVGCLATLRRRRVA